MTDIIQWYKNNIPDDQGRYLSDIMKKDDDWLESTHDYIQLLFPNKEPSMFNPNAPLLTNSVIEEFNTDNVLKLKVQRSFERMMKFYKIDVDSYNDFLYNRNNCILQEGKFLLPWWVESKHNHLRLTRILNTLNAFDMKYELHYLYNILMQIHEHCWHWHEKSWFSTETLEYWQKAAGLK